MKTNYVMEMLKVLAKEHSGDKKTQVAAGIFVSGVLKFGVNHLEYELPTDDIEARTELFYATMVHAEDDLCRKEDVRGKTVYVTLFPCDNCARLLIERGVKEIVVGEDRPDAPYIIRAKELLDREGIKYSVL